MTLVQIIPSFLTPVLHLVIGFFAAPLGMFIGADPYAYGMLPVILGITDTVGIDPQDVYKRQSPPCCGASTGSTAPPPARSSLKANRSLR